MQDAGVLLVEYGGIRVLNLDGLQKFRRIPTRDVQLLS